MMRNKSPSQKGFTLIELLVVTAVMGVLAIVSATVISNVLRSANKTNIINEVRQNGNIVIDKFERELKQAERVCITALLPLNCEGTGSGVTVTVGTDSFDWVCNTGDGRFTRDGQSVINEDPTGGVRVANTGDLKDCNFTVTGNTDEGIPQIVKLDFRLQQRNPAGTSEFETSVPFEVTVGTRTYTTN